MLGFTLKIGNSFHTRTFLILHGSIAVGNPFFLHFELHKLCKWVGVCNIRWVARGSNTIIKYIKVWKQKPAVFYERSIHENCVCYDLLQSKKNAKTLTIQTVPTIKEEDFTKIKLEVKGLFDLKECSQMNFCMVSEGYNWNLGGLLRKTSIACSRSYPCQPDWAGLPLIMSASFIFLCLDSSLLMESSNCGNPPRVLIEEKRKRILALPSLLRGHNMRKQICLKEKGGKIY